ncbi:MAG: helix-turn-helix domain-containing protein [Clostridiales bacterium]|nr:helix-turn-helix domain-containing protein [Clostridiales bacterium]
MDVNERIQKYMIARGWTGYRLAKESGLSNSTIANIFRRNNAPGIVTLESICGGLGITLAQFFADNDLVELTEEQRLMFDDWLVLSLRQKKAVAELIDLLSESND